jgi:tRNA wybutosine-synthesizing protein 1
MGAAVLAAKRATEPDAGNAEEKADGSKGAVLAGLTDGDDGEGADEAGTDGGGAVVVRPEMVTPLQRKALTKEGYKIIGSHSAVKLCRWTKHQLRGRGGCYKHTFYGITS